MQSNTTNSPPIKWPWYVYRHRLSGYVLMMCHIILSGRPLPPFPVLFLVGLKGPFGKLFGQRFFNRKLLKLSGMLFRVREKSYSPANIFKSFQYLDSYLSSQQMTDTFIANYKEKYMNVRY